MINVTIYNEFIHEKEMENVKAIYPDGIHGAIKNLLSKRSLSFSQSCLWFSLLLFTLLVL